MERIAEIIVATMKRRRNIWKVTSDWYHLANEFERLVNCIILTLTVLRDVNFVLLFLYPFYFLVTCDVMCRSVTFLRYNSYFFANT